MNTSAARPTSSMTGTAIRKPMPSVKIPSRSRISMIADRVMLKFSASLAWSSTKGMVSRFISQMISGPRKQPMLKAQPAVTRPPSRADRCANIAHCRSSAEIPLAGVSGGGGGGAWTVGSSVISLPSRPVDGANGRAPPHAPDSIPSFDRSIRPRHGHRAHQDRARADVRTRVDVAAHRLDGPEHVAQVAGDGEAIDRMDDRATLDPESGRPARIVAGDRVHPLAHQFGDHDPVAHPPHQLLES